MLVLGFRKLEQSPPKIKIDVNANRGSPTSPPPNGDIHKWGSGLESLG
jgi:hypothetical protein